MGERRIAGGKLIVIEGTDGSGKHTQSEALLKYLRGQNLKVRLGGFPMYKENRAGAIVGQMLHGELGDFNSIHPLLAAIPFALDRAEAQPVLRSHLNDGGIWVLDRYVVSNWAHGAAKFRTNDESWKYIRIIRDLEFNGLGIVQPDLNIFLRVPTEVSRRLMEERARREGRNLDEAEQNFDHQIRTLYFYDKLSEDPANRIAVVNCADDNGEVRSIESISYEVAQLTVDRIPELIES